MKYFIDTEFSERGPKHPIELISIGIVAEDGREFYGVNRDFNPRHANRWVKDNVLPFLHGKPTASFPYQGKEWARQDEILGRIQSFIGDDPSPEFWGYYCGYDWVVLCQVFGDMSGLPSGWPMYCHDLRQALDDRDLGRVKQNDDAPHDALHDARWVALTWAAYVGSHLPPGPDNVITRTPYPVRPSKGDA